MIPILPCAAIDPMLQFYTDLGFEVTYRQKSPNVYAAVKRGGIELHFYVLKGLEPGKNHGTCAVKLDDPAALHATFTASLKAARGTVPLMGAPRIGRWRKDSTRFNVVDPSGNYIRFVPRTEDTVPSRTPATELSHVLALVVRLRDSSGNDVEAAQVLDAGLRRFPAAPVRDLVRAYAARVELASLLNDPEVGPAIRTAFGRLSLSAAEQDEFRAEIQEILSIAPEAEIN